MLNIYEVSNKNIENIDSIKEGCWLDLVNPSQNEIKEVVEKTGIDKEILLKMLDEEELPRIEKRNEETLIILDTPYLADSNSKLKYKTNPLGIIISEKGFLITLSLKEQPFVDYFKNINIENFTLKRKCNLISQIFIMVAGRYQKELTSINEYINNREKVLLKSTNNKELVNLLNVEKTLVYFITSLRANEAALERIAKGNVIAIDKNSEEQITDALIETKQAVETATIYREILSSMTDTYATIISNNLNDIMKFLASITIVCSIPTMVASFIGMNVPLGPIGHGSFSFIIIIIVSIILSLLIAYILRKKNML